MTQADHHRGGVACARLGDLDTCCLVFLSANVPWTRLGYFLTNGTTYHLRFEVRWMHHTEHDWLELRKSWWLRLSVCWTDGYLCMIIIFVIVFLLVMVIWWLLICFIINLPLQFCIVWLVPMKIANLHSWKQMNNNRWHGGRFFFEGATKQTW